MSIHDLHIYFKGLNDTIQLMREKNARAYEASRFPDTILVDFSGYFPSSIAFLYIEENEYFLRKNTSHLRAHSLLTNS